MKPLIAVSGWTKPVSGGHGRDVDHIVTPARYVHAVSEGGGTPVVLPGLVGADVDGLLDMFDGLVLVGGADIDPAHYGEDALPTTFLAPAARDEFDLALAQACVERDIPTLAICRGMQVVNVALGGTLAQHVPEHAVSDRPAEPVHDVALEAGSRLARLLECEVIATNSSHHQVLERLGEGVRVVGRSHDGVAEVIEVDHAPNLLGVQWHPERMCDRREHLELFVDLARRAAKVAL